MYSLDIILKVGDYIKVSAALLWQASCDLTCFRNDTEACATFVIFLQSFPTGKIILSGLISSDRFMRNRRPLGCLTLVPTNIK